MSKEWDGMSEEELRAEAQTGLRGQGAIVEMLRRSGKDQRSIKWLTWAILGLTVFIAVLTVILVMRG